MLHKFALTLNKSCSFGELGIITGSLRARTIVAKCPTKLGFICAEAYSMMFKERELKKLKEKLDFFE